MAFKPYNSNTAPKFCGDISKVNNSEFTPQNSNARAFGVDIFANDPPKRPKQPQYNNVPPPPSIAKNNNPRPFGKANIAKQPNRTDVVGHSNYNHPAFGKPEIAHKWFLSRSFNPKKGEITMKIEDEVTHKRWKKVITKQEHHGDIKQEYFRIGSIIDNGQAKYKYPENGNG
eukprot:372640_1